MMRDRVWIFRVAEFNPYVRYLKRATRTVIQAIAKHWAIFSRPPHRISFVWLRSTMIDQSFLTHVCSIARTKLRSSAFDLFTAYSFEFEARFDFCIKRFSKFYSHHLKGDAHF